MWKSFTTCYSIESPLVVIYFPQPIRQQGFTLYSTSNNLSFIILIIFSVKNYIIIFDFKSNWIRLAQCQTMAWEGITTVKLDGEEEEQESKLDFQLNKFKSNWIWLAQCQTLAWEGISTVKLDCEEEEQESKLGFQLNRFKSK